MTVNFGLTLNSLKQHKWRFLAILFLIGVGGMYGILPVGRALLIAYPRRTPVTGTPGDAGYAYENVTLTTSTGVQLHGWYIASQHGATILIAHPYTSNRSHYLEQAIFLAEHGYGVLLFDLAAHGESKGRRVTLDGTDVLAAAAYLEGRADTKDDKIGAWGFSLGGMVSLQAAAQNDHIQAIVADGPFPIVAAEDMPKPKTLEDWVWLPFDTVQRLSLRILAIPPARSTIQALSQVAPRKVLLVSGSQNSGEQRVMRHYHNTASGNVILWEVADANHIESWYVAKETYQERVLQLFDTALLGMHTPRRGRGSE
jgi:hypothetical protein